jgi:hypothetical protein
MLGEFVVGASHRETALPMNQACPNEVLQKTQFGQAWFLTVPSATIPDRNDLLDDSPLALTLKHAAGRMASSCK